MVKVSDHSQYTAPNPGLHHTKNSFACLQTTRLASMFGALEWCSHLDTQQVNPVQVACSKEPLCILLWCKCTLHAQLSREDQCDHNAQLSSPLMPLALVMTHHPRWAVKEWSWWTWNTPTSTHSILLTLSSARLLVLFATVGHYHSFYQSSIVRLSWLV